MKKQPEEQKSNCRKLRQINGFSFRQKHRFLYSYTEFAVDDTRLRFYNYNKKILRQGFADAGLEDKP